MKICAVISEFNPFHNGHKYLLERARELSGCDAVLCIMSGSFTQRGEMCITDKYLRAKHAVLGGADCVIGLPAAFAVAPAEIFARGAVKILSSIPDVCVLAFGCENDEADFKGAAEILAEEPQKFKQELALNLERGESYIRSYAAAFVSCGGDKNLVSNPNNILGTEYTKAILKSGAKIDILPIKRKGSGYGDGILRDNFSSAGAIRNNLHSDKIRDNVPEFVYEDLKPCPDAEKNLELLIRAALLEADFGTNKIYGCTEGLENALKGLAGEPLSEIIQKVTSKRYSAARIRRILLSNTLGLSSDDCARYLDGDLYINVLAQKRASAPALKSSLSLSRYPTLGGDMRDLNTLSEEGKSCYGKDMQVYRKWRFLNGFGAKTNSKTLYI